jgi:predicted  nucleic acid-binding Zn-ribbon protein
MPGQLDIVVRLQQAVADLRHAERQLAGVPTWMEELHEEHSASQARIAAEQASAEEADRNRRKAEAATQDAQERLRHYQQQVRQVRTQREYAALLQEIDTVKAQIKALEETALTEMEANEQARQRLEAERSSSADLAARYGEALARWESEKPGVEQQAATLRREVAELREQLPRPVVSTFDRLLDHRSGRAIAPLRRGTAPGTGDSWHCSACNYRVRLQLATDLRTRGVVVQCEGCKRILYVEDEAAG